MLINFFLVSTDFYGWSKTFISRRVPSLIVVFPQAVKQRAVVERFVKCLSNRFDKKNHNIAIAMINDVYCSVRLYLQNWPYLKVSKTTFDLKKKRRQILTKKKHSLPNYRKHYTVKLTLFYGLVCPEAVPQKWFLVQKEDPKGSICENRCFNETEKNKPKARANKIPRKLCSISILIYVITVFKLPLC